MSGLPLFWMRIEKRPAFVCRRNTLTKAEQLRVVRVCSEPFGFRLTAPCFRRCTGSALRDDGHMRVTVDGNTNPRPLPGAARADVPTVWARSRSTPAEQAARLADTPPSGGHSGAPPPTRGKAPIRTGRLPRVVGPSKMGEVLSRRPGSFDGFV